MLSKKCIICDKTFTSYPSDNRKFCSHKCYHLSLELHGMAYTEFYGVWHGMKRRCNNKQRKDYCGRGITVCDRWKTFLNFRNDMHKSYKEHKLKNDYTTLDRIDNDGNYCKENCRWATMKEQTNNTRNNRFLTYKGQTLTISQWADKLNINYAVFWYRIQTNWSIKKILETPTRKYY